MKRTFFALAFALALLAHAVSPLVAEPFDTAGIPADALVVFHTDSKKGVVTPGDLMKVSVNDKDYGVLNVIGNRLGFDAAKDVATCTLVVLPQNVANSGWNLIGVVLRGNLPVEKILAAAQSGPASQAVVRVGERSLIKTFHLNGMEKISAQMPTIAVPIDDKTLLVVVGTVENDAQPFLAAFDGKVAKFAVPQALDALCKQLAPAQGILYFQGLKDGLAKQYLPGCKEFWAVLADDAKTVRLRARGTYADADGPAATERAAKTLLGQLQLASTNVNNSDGTPNIAKAALGKRLAELHSAIKLTVSDKAVSADADYPSADFLKLVEALRNPPADTAAPKPATYPTSGKQ